ncbi:MAG: UvrD-helicase domain-containing protein [Bacteroidia bacterium]|nr:UvrD-helicase domain-containing protein [Bacteroidia bacterium]
MENVDFLKELNPSQQAAVMNVEGPQMVIAGAGSGKTRVLTYRLAFILSQGLAYPQELLSLTFTNKAAKEMKERIQRLVGPEAKSIVMGTFHSIFSRILRVEAERIGYTRAFTIYDSDDSNKMVKTLLKERNLDDKVFKPKVIQHAISSAKNKLISPKEYLDFVTDDFNMQVAKIYEIYEQRLFKSNAMDFDDLLIKPILLFKTHPDILYKYQHRFRYIMVDEYQDTNHAQYILTNMLAAAHQNICVVGDDAQSIYGFRGANIQNILNLKKDYPDLEVYKLEQNYRSTNTIVQAANSIIAFNKDQIQKKVFTENEAGDKISVFEATSEQDEAKRVANLVREQRQVHSFFNKDFAILYRTNAQSRAMEDELRRAGINYKVFGGLSFYQRKEIKDMVAYFKLAVNPQDEAAAKRVINYPTRGIGQSSIEAINVYADGHNITFWDALQRVEHVGINTRAANRVKEFVMMIRDFGVSCKNNDAFFAASYIAKQSGILKDLHSTDDLETLGRWENVQELLNSAQGYVESPDTEDHSMEAFLADISLFTDQDQKIDDDDFVTLMTIHSAKGLEFKSVFIVGMEETLFPSGMALETRADLEEERRLFYVALTRAEKILTMSYARSRYRFGQMQFNEKSRFLDEVDDQYIKKPETNVRREALDAAPTARRGIVSAEDLAANRRAKVNRAAARPASAGSAAAAPDPNFVPSDPKSIQAGQTVRHLKFGKGTVIAVEEDSTGRKATVDFPGSGQRVLLLKFARLQIL